MADDPVPVTKIRVLVPKGKKIEEVMSKLEISFEEAADSGAEINTRFCCVDASVVGPFSTVSRR
jgi:hypothetical protein